MAKLRLPLKYNLASLGQRKSRSALTAGGVGLTVFLSVMMVALSRGLLHSASNSGVPENIILLSKGAETMEFSALDPAVYNLLKGMDGLAEGGDPETGQTIRLASPEAYTSCLVSGAEVRPGAEPRGVIRGVRPVAYSVHQHWKLVAGERPQRGFELAVGSLAAVKMGLPEEALAIGRTLHIEGRDWKIVGRFAAPGTVLESEMWTDLDDVLAATKRDDYSLITLRATSASGANAIAEELKARTDVRVEPYIESQYYRAFAQQLKPVQAVSVVMTVILVLGGLMAGMNTMFTSIAGRTREMGVLLVMGYRRRSVLLSFMLESVLLCLAGGLLGSLLGLTLNGLPLKIPMGAFRFAVDAATIGLGLGLALLIGVLGSLAPVLQAARVKIVEALRAN